MDLLLETNFLLELVYEQEQTTACERLLQAAERGEVALHLPTFCLAEQLYQFLGEREKRQELQEDVRQALVQAARETVDKSQLFQLERGLSTVLEVRSQQQQARLLGLSQRVARVAQVIELSASIWERAAQLAEEGALTLPDCVVCASLLERAGELGVEPVKLFATRDKRAFHQPAVRQLFQELGCEVVLNFEHAASRLRLG